MKVFIDASLIVYLNIRLPEAMARLVEDFYRKLLTEELYTDVLALDEAIYVSTRRYRVSLRDSLELVDRAVLPYVEILPLGASEYVKAKRYMVEYGLKPSDAIHLAAIDNGGVQAIVTEDRDFDRTHVRRIWVNLYAGEGI